VSLQQWNRCCFFPKCWFANVRYFPTWITNNKINQREILFQNNEPKNRESSIFMIPSDTQHNFWVTYCHCHFELQYHAWLSLSLSFWTRILDCGRSNRIMSLLKCWIYQSEFTTIPSMSLFRNHWSTSIAGNKTNALRVLCQNNEHENTELSIFVLRWDTPWRLWGANCHLWLSCCAVRFSELSANASIWESISTYK
jgi:hypothetical protein